MILTNKERLQLKDFCDDNPELAEHLSYDILDAILSTNKTVTQVLTDFMDEHLSEEKHIPEGATLVGTIRN